MMPFTNRPNDFTYWFSTMSDPSRIVNLRARAVESKKAALRGQALGPEAKCRCPGEEFKQPLARVWPSVALYRRHTASARVRTSRCVRWG